MCVCVCVCVSLISHIGFSVGIWHCINRSLSQMQIQVACSKIYAILTILNLFVAWKALSKKKKKAIKKKNFKNLEKAKKQVKKAIGADWPKIPRYFRQALIQFKVCVKNMKKYKKKFSFMWEMLLKGKPGKKIANKLKKTKWGKKHKGAAKQISKCLKKRIP